MTTTMTDMFTSCPWLVEVPSGNPEPDSPADLWRTAECGAPVEITHEGRGWRCEAGHEHLPFEIEFAPYGPAWEREESERRGWS